MATRFATYPRAAWSPFLGRPVRLTVDQHRLVTAIAARSTWRQRELAAAVGYTNPGNANRTLGHLRRLGLVAVSTSRGRHGHTVAWLRAGVRDVGAQLGRLKGAMTAAAREMLPPRTGTYVVPIYPTGRAGNIYAGGSALGHDSPPAAPSIPPSLAAWQAEWLPR